MAKAPYCVVPDCPNSEKRSDLDACFGRHPNSNFASALFKSDPERYRTLRKEAQEKGLMNLGTVPAALRED